MTHLETSRTSPLETGGDLGRALASCAWLPGLSSGQPQPPRQACSGYNKRVTTKHVKNTFKMRMQNPDSSLTPTQPHIPNHYLNPLQSEFRLLPSPCQGNWDYWKRKGDIDKNAFFHQ